MHARRQRPQHGFAREQVNVFVDGDDSLEPAVGQRRGKRVARFAARWILQLQVGMKATALCGHMHIDQRWRDAADQLEQLALHGHVVRHQHVGEPGAIVVIDRIVSHRDATDLEGRRLDLWPQVTGVFTEGTIRRVDIRRRKAFDHDFCVGRHHDPLAMKYRRHQPQGFTEHATRRAPVTLGIPQLRLCAEQHRRMVADPERNRTGFTLRPELAQIAGVMCRGIGKVAHAPRTLDPTALDRRVVDSGVGIVGRRMRRSQIRSGLEFVLGQDR